MQLILLTWSSYSLDWPTQPTTTITMETHKTIVEMVNFHFILKDQVSRLGMTLELYLDLWQLMSKSP